MQVPNRKLLVGGVLRVCLWTLVSSLDYGVSICALVCFERRATSLLFSMNQAFSSSRHVLSKAEVPLSVLDFSNLIILN